MVFARLPSILFAWHGVHEKRINSKPFMFAQNFSVCECKFRLSNAVLSLCLFVETFLEIDTEIPIWSSFLFQNQRNHERLVMNENTAEFWNLFLLRVLFNKIFLFVSFKGNLTLLFFTHEWLQKIWQISDSCSHSQNKQTRSQSSGTSRDFNLI